MTTIFLVIAGVIAAIFLLQWYLAKLEKRDHQRFGEAAYALLELKFAQLDMDGDGVITAEDLLKADEQGHSSFDLNLIKYLHNYLYVFGHLIKQDMAWSPSPYGLIETVVISHHGISREDLASFRQKLQAKLS
jgi:hypothetical protein